MEKERKKLKVDLKGLQDDLELSEVTSEKKEITRRIEQSKKQMRSCN